MKSRASNDHLTTGIGQKASHGFRRGTGRTLAVVVGLMACLSMQTLSAQSGSPSATAASAATDGVGNRPARRIDDPADIAALTRFLTDFSLQKDELERRAALLVGIPEVRLKDSGYTLVRGGDSERGWSLSVSHRVFVSAKNFVDIKINYSLDSCISETSWLKIIDDTLALSVGHDLTNSRQVTPWRDSSGGPDWPAGMISRFRTLPNGIAVGYYYYFRDHDRCVFGLNVNLPGIVKENK